MVQLACAPSRGSKLKQDELGESNFGKGTLRHYIGIARPDHWFKNIFVLPGAALAYLLGDGTPDAQLLEHVIIGLVSACLLASANYTINEWLDAKFDTHHPVKKSRPSALGQVQGHFVFLQWAVLSLVGLGLAATINMFFLLFAAIFVLMGVVYNVRPLRTKDTIYLDVLSESFNNPLRFMLGWHSVVVDLVPPSSLLLAYWMGGAYLMTIKRYAEYRFIGDPKRAGLYRQSFKHYTEESLLLSAFFYALSAAFFLGVFLIKYRVEFLLAMPFLALLFVWYLRIGMRTDSVTQSPEKLYRERAFVLYIVILVVFIGLLFVVDLPWLNLLLEQQPIPLSEW